MRTAIVITILLICTSSSHAEDQISCGDVLAVIQQTISSIGKENFVYQLKRNGQTHAILALSAKKPVDAKTSKWRLLEREGESLTYCVASEGIGIEMLMSLHTGSPPAKYGLPSSGQPRCFEPRPNALPGSLEVRLWANKELGDSTVIHLSSSKGDKDYTFLTSNDNTGYWILLEADKNNINNSCYRSRGDASDIKVDYWPFKENTPGKIQ